MNTGRQIEMPNHMEYLSTAGVSISHILALIIAFDPSTSEAIGALFLFVNALVFIALFAGCCMQVNIPVQTRIFTPKPKRSEREPANKIVPLQADDIKGIIEMPILAKNIELQKDVEAMRALLGKMMREREEFERKTAQNAGNDSLVQLLKSQLEAVKAQFRKSSNIRNYFIEQSEIVGLDLTADPVHTSQFSEMFKATYQGKPVAVKRLVDVKDIRAMLSEVSLFSAICSYSHRLQLGSLIQVGEHKNIAAFRGVVTDNEGLFLLVTDFVEVKHRLMIACSEVSV